MCSIEQLARFVDNLHDQGVRIKTIRLSKIDYDSIRSDIWFRACESSNGSIILTYLTEYGEIVIERCSKSIVT